MFSPCQKGHNRRIARYIWTFFFFKQKGNHFEVDSDVEIKKMVNKSWLKTDMISNHFLPFVTWNDNLNEGHVWKPQVRGKPGRSWYINPFFNIVSMPFWGWSQSCWVNFTTSSQLPRKVCQTQPSVIQCWWSPAYISNPLQTPEV